MLDRLKAPKGANRQRKRVGRGEGGGSGKTSGKGGKGQTARSGGNIKPGFEGGQMPLQRRLPKRGFTNIFRVVKAITNVGDLARVFKTGDVVDAQTCAAKGLVRGAKASLKILGDGDINIPLTVKAGSFSKSAVDKIKAAGGATEVV